MHSRDEEANRRRTPPPAGAHRHQLSARTRRSMSAEGIDHPVPYGQAFLLACTSRCFAVPRDIQPMPRPAFAIQRGGQQFVHQLEVCLPGWILLERPITSGSGGRPMRRNAVPAPEWPFRLEPGRLTKRCRTNPIDALLDWHCHFAERFKGPLGRHLHCPRRHALRKAGQRHRQQNIRFHAEAHPPTPAALGQALFLRSVLRPLVMKRPQPDDNPEPVLRVIRHLRLGVRKVVQGHAWVSGVPDQFQSPSRTAHLLPHVKCSVL